MGDFAFRVKARILSDTIEQTARLMKRGAIQ